MFRTALTNRITRTVLGAGLAGAASLALVATPVAADAAPRSGCTDTGCILDVAVQPDGLSLGVTVDTGPDTTATFSVYKGGTLAGQSSDPVLRRTHTLSTASTLTPNTTYTWHARVSDSGGHSVERTGEVSTLHRRVTVQFTTVTVTNDSDANSAGDFETYVGIPGARAIPPLTPGSINSGETKLLGAVLQQRDAGPTTLIQTELWDDDNLFLVSYWPELADVHWTSGSVPGAFDYATASGTVRTDTATHGIVPFQISVNSYVGFIVKGYYSVDFVS